MKWIFAFLFLASNLMAESNFNELPADVQKDIKSTEAATVSVAVSKESSKSTELTPIEVPAVEATVAVAKSSVPADAKESEIPLSFESSKKASASESTYFRMIMIIALLGILACGTWIFVRKAKTQNIKRNRNEIKILAQHHLGPKKSLAVVRVAGESILVGITDAQINMIKTLSLLDDELSEVTSQNFQSELDTRMSQETTDAQTTSTYSRRAQANTKANTKANVTDDEIEEFSIRGIKDLVSTKLKNMRSI